MSSNIFLISDTHFSHENIIGYGQRPFSDIYDMNETMISRWNSVVKPKDKVYHLGDVYFGSEKYADEILSRLNGKKRLILGNHDNGKSKLLQKHFEKIVLFRAFKEFKLLLSHVPVHPMSLKWKDDDGRNVHGHIHEKIVEKECSAGGYLSKDDRYVNVCVEHTDYTPVSIEEIRA